MALSTAAAVEPLARAEDVGNIVLLEHVNVTMPDQALSTLYYIVGLGFTRDPHMTVGLNNMWVNLGEQQFHLPTGKPQVLRGHAGLVVRDLDALKERLQAIALQLQGTQFSWSDRGEFVETTSPWGNRYRCYAAGRFGSMHVGMPYVEFTVPRGAAESIQRFYDQVFEAPAVVEQEVGSHVATVEIGTQQRLIFRDTDDVPDYDGHHVAIYVANFSKPYQFLAEHGLLTEGINNHQFRFQDIVDPATGHPVFTVEHEVRSTRHTLFRRPLVNREPEHPPMVMQGRAR